MNKSKQYTLVPHFYRLNWAREMSTFFAGSDIFTFEGDLKFGNYKKAAQLRDNYLNDLLEKEKRGSLFKKEKKNLFFVNLNDFIFYERMYDLKNEYNIYGFMRGSKFFDSEPGNNSVGSDTELGRKKEIEGLALVDGLFLGSNAFHNFLLEKNPSVSKIETKVVGIPIFKKPCFLGKSESEKRAIMKKKEKGLIIWNHRLQKQKNPWVLFLLEESIKKNLAICTPEALSAAYSKEMKENEDVFKYIVRDNGGRRNDYLNVLNRAQLVLSTSEHETWGNSVVEALMSGALPILPDGELCSYKELFPEQFLYPQSWLNKKEKIEVRKNSIKKLSNLTNERMNFIDYNLIEGVQNNLWDKFNSETWRESLFFANY
jgi:hypothetical protein